MAKYIAKRILLMFFTLFIISTICFFLIKAVPQSPPEDALGLERWKEQQIKMGYDKPVIVQFLLYLKNIFTEGYFGLSWKIAPSKPVIDLFMERFPPTIIVNFYSLIIATPIGIALGIYAAIKKNKWQDQVISIVIMLFVSIPSYVYAFMLQYIFYYQLDWFPQTIKSLAQAGNSWFSWTMFHSMILPIIALSFGTVAGLARFTRAELTETLTSDYMLLARTKGLTRGQATMRHALKNAMVPILPMIISSFIGILGGSLIVEQIFAIPGVGQLYLDSINLFDYDVFMFDTIFYTLIGLSAGIVVDISYGFIDPRIRMGEK